MTGPTHRTAAGERDLAVLLGGLRYTGQHSTADLLERAARLRNDAENQEGDR